MTKVVDIQICVYQIRKGVLCNLKRHREYKIFPDILCKNFDCYIAKKKGQCMVGIFRKTLADLAILDNQGSQLCGTKDVVTHFIHSIACSVYYNTCAIFC